MGIGHDISIAALLTQVLFGQSLVIEIPQEKTPKYMLLTSLPSKDSALWVRGMTLPRGTAPGGSGGTGLQKYLRPLQFNYLSYELFLEKKSCQTPKKKKKKVTFGVLRTKVVLNFSVRLQKKKRKKCKF